MISKTTEVWQSERPCDLQHFLPMTEAEIKKALAAHLQHRGKGVALLEELELSGGKVRADLVDALAMHCYEIKSHRDSLARLLGQGVRYNWVFDQITLITVERHLKKALNLLPDWWGVILVEQESSSLFTDYRAAQTNYSLNPVQLGRVLKRDECLAYLADTDQLKGNKSKNLSDLQSLVASQLDLPSLKSLVKSHLVARAQRTRDAVGFRASAVNFREECLPC